MNDSISRQAVISAICNACGKIDCDKMDKCEKLQLPPANCSEFPNNSDTISRQAAIDAVAEFLYYTSNFDGMRQGFDLSDWKWKMEGVLSDLPSAQPERKSKKCVWCDSPYRIEYYWIDKEGCTASFQDEERHIVATGIANFCPNCGAKMRGEQDG